MAEYSSEKTEARLRDLLGDPIVHLVMQSDNVDMPELLALLERTAASIREWRDAPRTAEEKEKSTTSDDGCRRGVGIMLLNARGDAFVGQRAEVTEEAWQMPQGGIDEGETPRDAALRELQEELGTSKVKVIAETMAWFRYDLPGEFLARRRHGGWRGQKQKWFLMRFLGQDSDIDIATEHREFSQWQWVTRDQLVELAVPFKRQLYLDVLQEFADLMERAAPQGPRRGSEAMPNGRRLAREK